MTDNTAFIPYGRQWIDEEDIRAVADVLKGDYITTGPAISRFEAGLAEASGADYAVAVSSGTAALHAACFAAGLAEGDEVITSPMTFAASANCILYMGARPVFADIDEETYNISPEAVAGKITQKTRAILPVHFTGQPCRMDEILELAGRHGLAVIADGAHALGAEYKNQKIGGMADMTTFSFHPVKHITTGEGGAVVTGSRELRDRLLLFRNHGITRDGEKLSGDCGPWYYEQLCPGYNYRLSDIHAALGLSQLKKLGIFLEKRRKYAALYDDAFRDLEGIITPRQLEGTASAWHLYIIRLEPEKLKADRRTVFEELRRLNIGVNVHYIPVYYHPYYRQLGYEKGICPNAERLYERIITLPLFPGLTQAEIEYVIEGVRKVVAKYLA